MSEESCIAKGCLKHGKPLTEGHCSGVALKEGLCFYHYIETMQAKINRYEEFIGRIHTITGDMKTIEGWDDGIKTRRMSSMGRRDNDTESEDQGVGGEVETDDSDLLG